MVEIKDIPTHYCKAPKVFGWWTVAVIGSQELVIFRQVSQPRCLTRHKNEPYHLYLIASVHHIGAYNKNKQGVTTTKISKVHVHIDQLPISSLISFINEEQGATSTMIVKHIILVKAK